MSKLTVNGIRAIDKTGRTWDKHGLHVWAQNIKGTKNLRLYWAQKINVDGRSTTRTFGAVDPKAKDLAQQIREQRAAAEARLPKARKGFAPTSRENKARLFHTLMMEYYERKLVNKSPAYRKEWIQKMKRHCGVMMDWEVSDEIRPVDIANVLEPIWNEKKKTARDIRKIIRSVFDYAKFKELITGDNPAGDSLDAGLPDISYQTKSHPSLPYSEVSKAVNKIIASSSRSAVTGCLILIALTAVRSQEARGARWDEIDFEKRLWTIPAERMKKRRPHIVPLSDAAIRVLETARHNFTERQSFYLCFNPDWSISKYKEGVDHLQADAEGGGLVFPGHKGNQLSAAALCEACSRNEIGCVPHGFRASFRSWCQDTEQPREASELCLAHRIGDEKEQVYKNGEILERRRKIMQGWADYLEQTDSV